MGRDLEARPGKFVGEGAPLPLTALSLELRELERETNFCRNNIHDRLAQTPTH
jgi:5-carboxymethyl-2-hydroxymuconate isomerase